MKIKEILKALNGATIKGSKKGTIKGFAIDTRKLNEGDAFIVLEGSQSYIADAIKKKAKLLIVSEDISVSGITVIKVKDTYQALVTLALYLKEKYNPYVIAITGSAGKSTTKELISAILKTKYPVLKSAGNMNNHLGLPLSLLKLDRQNEIAVLELGMNHEKEISYLSKLCKPNLAVITNIGSSHIGNLKSRYNIYRAKMEIFDGMENKVGFVNGKDFYLRRLIGKKGYQVYSHLNNIKIKKVISTILGLDIFFIYQGKEYHIHSSLMGRHFAPDILLAVQVGLYLAIDIEDIITALNNYEPLEERMKLTYLKDGNILLDDTYNASFESFKALINFAKEDAHAKVFIAGDMKELGNYNLLFHRKIAKRLAKLKNTKVLLIGKTFSRVKGNFLVFNSNAEIIDYLKSQNYKNTLYILKGAHAMHLDELALALKKGLI